MNIIPIAYPAILWAILAQPRSTPSRPELSILGAYLTINTTVPRDRPRTHKIFILVLPVSALASCPTHDDSTSDTALNKVVKLVSHIISAHRWHMAKFPHLVAR